MDNAIQVLLSYPQNRWVLGCFALFLALPVLFAGLYLWLYRKNEANFFFPRDPVFENRLQRQKESLIEKRAQIEDHLQTLDELIEYVTEHADQLKSSSGSVDLELPDGRQYRFEHHEDVNATGPDVYVSTKLTVLDRAGSELRSIWLDHDGFAIPSDALGMSRALSAYCEEWQRNRTHIENQLAAVQSGRVLWSFEDFLYFSVLTQTTLGCNDMIPNSTKVRRLVLLQMLVAFAILVVLVNVVILGAS
jgi:hypothetical protein